MLKNVNLYWSLSSSLHGLGVKLRPLRMDLGTSDLHQLNLEGGGGGWERGWGACHPPHKQKIEI